MKRLSMEKCIQRQNIQLSRIFKLRDPLLSIIYIAPYDLSPELISYYHKVLELGEVSNYKNRLYFVNPENHSKFPSHFTTSKLLQFSPKAIKRIKLLIKNKVAYLVPGWPCNDDIKLADLLNIPIFSGNCQQNLVMSTKSASKRLFNSLEIPTSPGSYEIYDEKEFINSLALLIANNLSINVWVFKIDDEFHGRGIAYLKVKSIKALRDICKQQ